MTEYIIDMSASSYQSSSGLLSADVSQLREAVVRCRDCEKFDPDFKHDWDEMWWCKGLCHYTPPDGFCSFGKRREA